MANLDCIDINSIRQNRNSAIISEIQNGNISVSAKRASEITGWSADAIKNSIRDGKAPFGFCHRGENCKSWSTVIDLQLLYDYINRFHHESG